MSKILGKKLGMEHFRDQRAFQLTRPKLGVYVQSRALHELESGKTFNFIWQIRQIADEIIYFG